MRVFFLVSDVNKDAVGGRHLLLIVCSHASTWCALDDVQTLVEPHVKDGTFLQARQTRLTSKHVDCNAADLLLYTCSGSTQGNLILNIFGSCSQLP